MEWNIKSSSSCCECCRKVFSDGSRIVSYACVSGNGEIIRADVHEDCVENFSLPGKLLGQWRRTISLDNENHADFRQKMISQEEFFFSLFEGESSREKELLKIFLSLLLEKNRILKSDPRISDGKRKFTHIKTRREFLVEEREILPEELASVLNAFEILFR